MQSRFIDVVPSGLQNVNGDIHVICFKNAFIVYILKYLLYIIKDIKRFVKKEPCMFYSSIYQFPIIHKQASGSPPLHHLDLC